MRGSVYHLLLGAVVLGLLLPVMTQQPANADSFTKTIAGILNNLQPILGLGLLLLGVGVAVVWVFGSRGTGGF